MSPPPTTGRLADVPLREILRRLARFRPVLITVAVTLGVLRALPGAPTTDTEHRATDTSTTPGVPPAEVAAGQPVPSSSPDDGTGTSTPNTTTTIALSGPAVERSIPTTSMPTPPASPTTASPSTPTADTTTTIPPSPVVVHSAWATQGADSPTATLGVPEGTLPVGQRLGQLDKASFLRLEGSWEQLGLTTDDSGTRGVGDARVRACAITTPTWDEGRATSFEDAPHWNVDDCVAGRADAGTWYFDLTEIDHRAGIALLPGRDAPAQFQIAFVDPT